MMMRKAIFWSALTVFAGLLTGPAVHAQSVSGSFFASEDSDDFRESKQTVGYTASSGWGLRAGAMRYTSPAWAASGQMLAGTFQRTDDRRTVDAYLGAARVAGFDYVVAGLDYMERLRPGTSLGLSVERDVVNSVRGIDTGTHFTALALVLDHAFSQRFNVGVAAGAALFSNDNNRPILRTRWNYSLNEDYGLNLFLKTRNYHNTNPYRREYFSPDRLSEVSAGLSARFAVAQAAVLSASVDAGQQRIDGASEPIWRVAVGLGARRNDRVQWFVGLEASDAAPLFSGQAGSYRYTSATARVTVPF